MIKSNYKILFGIQFFHSYFEKDRCDCLTFHAGDITRKLMHRFGFKIDNYDNGFKFFVNTTNTLKQFLDYVKSTTGETYFDFDIYSTNSKFYLFTDLPVNWVGQLLFDSQITLNSQDNDSIQLKATLSPKTDSDILGRLKIHFEDILSTQALNGSAKYEVKFESRATQWQYYVINKSDIPLDNPIVTGKSEIQFDGPKNITIQNGQEALLFSSGQNLIPLSNTPKYIFDLVNNKNGTQSENSKNPTYKPIFSGLPNPDPSRMGIIEVNGKNRVSSPMYIYV